MAINPSNRYPNNVDPASTEYPYGKARDVTEAGDDTGTPFQEDLINDLFGFQQALLVESNTTPSGTPDTATNSQQLNAVKDITSKPVGAEFETILALITGVSLNRGSNFDFASYIANGNRKVKTTYNNLTSKAGSAEYIIKTLVQAAADGDVIDGTGAPNYIGGNHALSDGVHCAVLDKKYRLELLCYGAIADYDWDLETGTDNTDAFQSIVNYAYELGIESSVNAITPQETNYKTSSRIKINVPAGAYYASGAVTVRAPTSGVELRGNVSFTSEGAVFAGNNSNTFLSFLGSATKNQFENITFGRFGTAIRLDSNNKNESMFTMTNCQSMGNDTFIDTVGYTDSRSTMMTLSECTFSDTRRVITHYTDHLTLNGCWIYAKFASGDAPFYLSGDGQVTFDKCFFIPHGAQSPAKGLSRFIDYVCDPAQSSSGDRSLKNLSIKGCRMSLESGRGFIWSYDLNGIDQPDGERGKYTSITLEDSYIGGLAGQACVQYKQGWVGSVNFRNTRFLAGTLCSIDPSNTQPPTPSNPDSAYGFLSHTITVDEATRATMGFSGNNILPENLLPFLYDTTSQTSKFNRSIRTNIDYRLKVTAAPAAGTNFVKASIPIYFDKTRTGNTPCRDLLTFMVTTYSDARGQSLSNPWYSAASTMIVSVIGGNSGGTTTRRIVATPVQDAQGGISFASSVMPTSVHFGTGDTGSNSINVTALNGDEDNITIVFPNTPNASLGFVYVLPLAGSRNNYFGTNYQQGPW